MSGTLGDRLASAIGLKSSFTVYGEGLPLAAVLERIGTLVPGTQPVDLRSKTALDDSLEALRAKLEAGVGKSGLLVVIAGNALSENAQTAIKDVLDASGSAAKKNSAPVFCALVMKSNHPPPRLAEAIDTQIFARPGAGLEATS